MLASLKNKAKEFVVGTKKKSKVQLSRLNQ